jgi:hypothetical protein
MCGRVRERADLHSNTVMSNSSVVADDCIERTSLRKSEPASQIGSRARMAQELPPVM